MTKKTPTTIKTTNAENFCFKVLYLSLAITHCGKASDHLLRDFPLRRSLCNIVSVSTFMDDRDKTLFDDIPSKG